MWPGRAMTGAEGGPRAWSPADWISLAAIVAGGLGLAILALLGPMGWLPAALTVGGLLALVGGGLDLRTRRVPNVLTILLLVLGLAVTAVRLGLGELGWSTVVFVLAAWVGCLAIWALRLFGGGDIKLLMGLLALAPDLNLVLALALALVLGLAVYLTYDQRSGRWRNVVAIIFAASVGRTPPSRDDVAEAYQRRNSPAAPWIALGFVGYCLGWAGLLF